MAIDIVVLSNDEKYFNPSWDLISKQFPHAKHVFLDSNNPLKQIANYINTSQFWIVLPNTIIADFNFDFEPDIFEKKIINLFSAVNSEQFSLCLVNKLLFLKLLTSNRLTSIYSLFSQNVKIQEQKIGLSILLTNEDLDIILLSYDEPNAQIKFLKLQEKYGHRIKHVQGVKGIANAHIEAAKRSMTDSFFVIDADADIVDSFKFDYSRINNKFNDIVYVWHSINPINGLEYGVGGVKLFNKNMFDRPSSLIIDVTTSISNGLQVIPEVSCITRFNTSPFSTWRTAFRECTKLSSNLIEGHIPKENEERLHIWRMKADIDSDFYQYCLTGACHGTEYGLENANDFEALRKINDFEWLQERFTNFFGF